MEPQAVQAQNNLATQTEQTVNSDRLDQLLHAMISMGASDVHLRMGIPPMVRVHGSLRPVPEWPALTKPLVQELFAPILGEREYKIYLNDRSIDTSYSVPGLARFRVNLFFQQDQPGGVLRQIPEDIPTLETLKAPAIMREFAGMPRGLVLVTGPTGSGKSTTLAALIDLINKTRHDHILTIEDPVEFVHQPKQSVINHREVGKDTPSFAKGLKDALRQDPDVILVGEMREYETISLGLTAAETGHLVFATLHTSSAPSSIDRVIDAFPKEEQQQARTMLAGSLVGIVTQTLLPTKDGKGRVAAHEILVANNAIRAAIRQGKQQGMRNELQTKTADGMQTLDRALCYLIQTGVISEEEGRSKSQEITEFDKHMANIRSGKGVLAPKLLGVNDTAPKSTAE